ncbi:MAG: glutamate-5-semialdehyde dehydrogenase [Anaeroplasma sp.]|nr:glutamate-5-semialdehyde dehydrogenase [Anaeroplasma sp.]
MLDNDLKKVNIAQKSLIKLSNDERKQCLINIKNSILENSDYIINENLKDIENARGLNLKESLIERLTLNEKRINALALAIDSLIELEDVVFVPIEEIKRPNGLVILKERVPFGTICAIFESRPNVSVDIATLCLKTANACVLKGGKEAIFTNIALVNIMRNAIKDIVDPNCIFLIESTSREVTNELIVKKEYIDLLIPRGGKNLIQYIVSNAKVPYIETGAGNCHLYIHEDANIKMAIDIAINAKYQRPSVCNSIENIIVHEKIAQDFLKELYDKFSKLNIEMLGCKRTMSIINCKEASEEDFYTEYNDYKVSIKIVDSIDEAISHINEHSSKHSEAIVCEDENIYTKFMNEIDSACVYHNASTRFTDGGEFGFGAEIGISTQKLHARGPMGLKEICSYKYKIFGNGQVR